MKFLYFSNSKMKNKGKSLNKQYLCFLINFLLKKYKKSNFSSKGNLST